MKRRASDGLFRPTVVRFLVSVMSVDSFMPSVAMHSITLLLLLLLFCLLLLQSIIQQQQCDNPMTLPRNHRKYQKINKTIAKIAYT
jgi:hypothetical protein